MNHLFRLPIDCCFSYPIHQIAGMSLQEIENSLIKLFISEYSLWKLGFDIFKEFYSTKATSRYSGEG